MTEESIQRKVDRKADSLVSILKQFGCSSFVGSFSFYGNTPDFSLRHNMTVDEVSESISELKFANLSWSRHDQKDEKIPDYEALIFPDDINLSEAYKKAIESQKIEWLELTIREIITGNLLALPRRNETVVLKWILFNTNQYGYTAASNQKIMGHTELTIGKLTTAINGLVKKGYISRFKRGFMKVGDVGYEEGKRKRHTVVTWLNGFKVCPNKIREFMRDEHIKGNICAEELADYHR